MGRSTYFHWARVLVRPCTNKAAGLIDVRLHPNSGAKADGHKAQSDNPRLCVENLPVFAAIVLAAEAAGLHSATLDVLSVGLVAARVVQTSAHLASGSNAAIAVRSTFFSVQLAAFVWMVALVVVHAAAK
jgi:uncharacterized MAPEG superfamily protein